MNKVVTINLNGRAYQLEEQGYEALRRYLDGARAKLGDNPDKDEIMADFEQAIADKCDTYFSGHKTVIGAKEVEEIIEKMGPVDGSGGAAKTDGANTHGGKHLYRIYEGAWLFGVCNGLAAYFNLDVALVRVLFVLFTILTHWGGGILVYVILAIIMRRAETEDQIAAAYGAAPFNAHEFIERARAEYAKFAKDPAMNKYEWKWRARQLKHEWRAKRREWRNSYHEDWQRRYSPGTHAAMGVFSAIVGIAIAALTLLWIIALWKFLTTGIVFGFMIGAGHPVWLSLLFLTALYYVILTPFKAMLMGAQMKRWKYYAPAGGYAGYEWQYRWTFVRTLFFLAAVGLLAYAAIQLFPGAHEIWATIKDYLNSTPR